MNILVFAAPKSASWFFMVLIVTVAVIGFVYLFVLLRKRIFHGKTYVAARAKAETIGGWEYSAAEWQKYALEFGLSKNPQGAATVRITPLDLWFTDDAGALRKPIGSSIMMVTDCRYSDNSLKIRIRSHRDPGKNNHDHYRDYSIPVPADKALEAQRAIELFADYIEQNPKKLDWVTPHAALRNFFQRNRFLITGKRPV